MAESCTQMLQQEVDLPEIKKRDSFKLKKTILSTRSFDGGEKRPSKESEKPLLPTTDANQPFLTGGDSKPTTSSNQENSKKLSIKGSKEKGPGRQRARPSLVTLGLIITAINDMRKRRQRALLQEVTEVHDDTPVPEPEVKFNSNMIQPLMEYWLESTFCDVKYEANRCKELALQLTDKILQDIKSMNFARYKVICHVAVGEKPGQSVAIASQCLWDSATDDFINASYINDTLFAVAFVHGIYYESGDSIKTSKLSLKS